MRAYLDHAATSPVRAGAVDAMLPYLTDVYGNPSSSHSEGREARKAIEDAREQLAVLLGCNASELIFTSGATEANNLFIRGAIESNGRRVLCTAIEHESVMQPTLHLNGGLIGVGRDGIVDSSALEAAIDANVSVVSIMSANNETGVVQPMVELVERVRSKNPHVFIHSDAVQAAPWCSIPDLLKPVDAFSISAHKFGGPKGIGALVVRDGKKFASQLLGGGQEQERRSGTQNVAGIVGMAAAYRQCIAEQAKTSAHVERLRDRLIDGLTNKVEDIELTAPNSERLPNNAHFVIRGVESEALVFALDEAGVAASAASACASGAMQPSHVLLAMGYSREDAKSSLRLTLGWNSTELDVECAIGVIGDVVTSLRSHNS
jgi:cysteine desulfurase